MLFTNTNELLYIQVYNYYKELIASGSLLPNSKLPSIRKCANQLEISKTTAESAYLLLAADGYIVSKPGSGYYVTNIATKKKEENYLQEEKKPKVLYDFCTTQVDKESFNLDLWRRYVKSALRQEERLLSYGDPQGEYELRQAVCKYLSSHRNVVCTPESIVVGAGFQSLLHILCPLLKDYHTIGFQDSKFTKGQAIFKDYHFEIEKSKNAQILYVTPSHKNELGDSMPVVERFQLLYQIQESNRLIIEDDFDSEFCHNRPAPSLQGLDRGEHVVYLCTFSKLLLPSIRISFMILPPHLLALYKKKKDNYNQTASKTEQIALCQFIRDGHFEAQIRKAQKFYVTKASQMMKEAKKIFSDCEVSKGDSGLIICIHLKRN
ncbi:putative transcriptional regulator of pyridoxine metabolism [Lachnospiraceae bacterium TWA4]|nr:putative transcriptional regulator of pyridoxine metabolism [Lachnospiraceae bacterium TWA4]